MNDGRPPGWHDPLFPPRPQLMVSNAAPDDERTNMTDEELKRLEGLCEKATPAPWLFNPIPGMNAIDDMWSGDDALDDAQKIIITDSGHYPPRVPDAEFIAAARTALPAALAEIRRLRGLVSAAETLGEENGCCAWCLAYRGQGEEHDHEPHGIHGKDKQCPAFTPDGTVR